MRSFTMSAVYFEPTSNQQTGSDNNIFSFFLFSNIFFPSVLGPRESREKPSDSPGTPLWMILFIIILLLVATFLLGRSVKKRCSRPADQLRMSRVDRVEDQEMRDESLTTDHTELFHAGSQLNNNDSSNLSAHVRSAEHSGACAVSEDSSDRVGII